MTERRVSFGWLDLAHPAATDGVVASRAAVTLANPSGSRTYTDPFGDLGPVDYACGTWTSQPRATGFAATSVVVSWAARTPASSWIEVAVRGQSGPDGGWSPWLVMARWAEADEEIHPTTVGKQQIDGVAVDTDEVRIDPDHAWNAVQVRVALLRRSGGADEPRLTRLGVLTSAVPRGPKAKLPPTSAPTVSAPIELAVPAYSQQLHRDSYPRYDGGGQSWCSPTSVSMVLAYFDALPPPHEYAWVEPQLADRFVPYVARQCFDHAYDGAGNWAFNAAYAGTRGLEAFVTRLRSLAEAEAFVAAGIPLVLSLAFDGDELDGAGYDTKGHLLVLIGFTAAGDPIVNDPASHRIPSDDEVRTVYRRDQIEALWLRSSGGVAYVLHPPEVPLPPAPAEPNW